MASRDEKLKLLEEDKAKSYGVTVSPPPVALENSRDAKMRLLQEDREKTPAVQLTQEQLEFKKGGPKNINFSQYDHNLEKLQSYGSKFQKYGFDPRIDNASWYNDQLTSSEQWARSFKGAGELLTTGFTDNMLFGAWASTNSSKDYAKTVDMYSSSKGGAEGFMQNLVLNAGYTVGIVADMVIEEAALAGITAVTFGGAAPETGGLMVAKGAQSFKNIRNAYNMYSNLSKTIRTVNTTNKLKNIQRVGNFLNPLENTTNFIKSLKNAETLKDVSASGKVMMGTGALFRDVKAVHLAKTEADLEGNMLNSEIYDDLVKNHEGPLTSQDADRYKKQADEASWWAKAENMVVIGATNKLVFNNMFKAFDDLKGLGKVVGETKFFNIVKEGAKDAKVVRKGLGGTFQRTKMMFSDGFGTGMKRTAKGITSKGGTYFSANIGEGFQETLQETINAKNKHMYGSEAQGTYWDNMLHGIKEQFTGQGVETFLSGFLMGTVVSPVNFTVKQVSSMKGGGYKTFTDPKNYAAGRSTEKNRLEADVKLINELFQDAGDVFKAQGNGIASQEQLEKEMMDAIREGDQHKFQNAKGKSYRSHLNTLMRHDMTDQFIDHLNEMKTMDAQQFGEAFKSVGNKTTKLQRDKIIDRKIQKVEEFKENHEWVKKNIINPIQLSKLDRNSPNYEAAKQYHDYFERAKEEIVFAKSEIIDNIERKDSILQGLRVDMGFGRTELEGNTAGEISFNEYQKLFNQETIDGEINLLKNEISGLNFSELAGEEKKLLKSKENKLESLSRFKESLDEMQGISAQISELEDSDPDMLTPKEKKELKRLNNQYEQATTRVFNRHNEYLKEIAPKVKGVAFTNLSEKSFKKLHDYYRLEEKDAGLDFLVNVLTNEKMLDEAVTRQVDMHKAFMAQFKRYVKNSMTMSRNKEIVQKGLNALYNEGIGFNLKHLDAVTDKGKMPPAFYNLETGEVIPEKITTDTGEKPNEKYVQAEVIVEEMYDNLLDKPTDNLKKASEKEKDTAEGEDFEGEGGKIDELTDQAGGATDRRAKYVPTEEDDVEISPGDTLDAYPPIVIDSLINEYRTQVENEDAVDKNIDDLNAENLTDRFRRWVNDSADAERIINEHNESVTTDAPTNMEVLSKEEQDKMREAGYETEEEVNQASREEVETALETGTRPEVVEEEFPEVVIVDNAGDNLEVFEPWIMKDVADSSDPNAQKHIDGIKALGQELDEANAEWVIGDMRAQVGGRLIVDVTANGKTFLMYKSLGKGTSAKTKGIWVPIPGFAANEKSWFIKGLDEGKDPKLTMYGSDKFRAISEDITAQEDTLFEEQIPDTVTTGEETFEKTKEERGDEGVEYRRSKALNLIDYAVERGERKDDTDDFFNVITAVEDVLLENLGEEVNGYEITEETIRDIYKILEKHPEATESGLQQFSGNLSGKIYELKNADIIEKQENNKKKRTAEMRKLKFTAKNMKTLNLKESEVTRIIDNQISYLDYVASLKRTTRTQAKEVSEYFASVDTNVRTQEELDAIVNEMSLTRGELFDQHSDFVSAEISKIKNQLAKLKGFENLKPGDIVEMKDGSLMKVDKLTKKGVELVNYNNIIQNRTSLTKAKFDEVNKRIVNDFNKDSKGLVSELEKQNINDLSQLLSSFTNGTLMSSEEVPTEQEMKDHFKLCK